MQRPALPHDRTRLAPGRLLALALLIAAFPALARAQGYDPRVELTVGYYEPSFDTQLRLDSKSLGAGTDLSLERDLGIDDSAREVFGAIDLRLSRRNHLVIDHVSFDRHGSGSLGRQVQFGDVVYAADADLTSRAKSDHTSVAWRFSVAKTPLADLGVSVGASWLQVEAEVSGVAVATANGVPVGSTPISEQGKASGPVPLAGVQGRWWIGRALRLSAEARYFDVNDFQGWNGSLTEYGARLEWFLSRNLAIGVGYASTEIKADFDRNDSSGRLDYKFDGLRATAMLAF